MPLNGKWSQAQAIRQGVSSRQQIDNVTGKEPDGIPSGSGLAESQERALADLSQPGPAFLVQLGVGTLRGWPKQDTSQR